MHFAQVKFDMNIIQYLLLIRFPQHGIVVRALGFYEISRVLGRKNMPSGNILQTNYLREYRDICVDECTTQVISFYKAWSHLIMKQLL